MRSTAKGEGLAQDRMRTTDPDRGTEEVRKSMEHKSTKEVGREWGVTFHKYMLNAY